VAKRHRVPLAKWAGTPIESKELAKKILSEVRTAVYAGTFDKAGRRTESTAGAGTFGELLDEYQTANRERKCELAAKMDRRA
jgi:hypothetical protein